ncbi:tellurium resistance protein [Rhodovulum sulfidophilum]|uniref:Tellurium resistance protein n=1 Tax=Rhodovulum visakhapatnamense TaxID=364297 RepID=A0ABS1RFA1_9RHOB|nr:tellurium resistance protein [Rhodovulum visakhapatnamense]MBL3570062.1 tellurium resistance protein [Rhodovulum visakhapatnamense]MBL3578328.1 tellurium resistance protein [Rhodovulum visakhapatnamense]OLS45152.1 tellurium resistance protein [Rhodovulum sulfidophilum]
MFTPRPRFATQTPPAIFPPVLGALGLGLAWRRAVDPFGVPGAAGDLILGAVTLLFLFMVVAYALKFGRRPGVLAEDLRVLPGRAGLSAAVLSVYVLSAALVPLARPLAEALLWAGLGLHLALLAVLIRGLATGPAEQRRVTPVWHLHFVGFIVACLPAVPLGHAGLATVLLCGTTGVALAIWAASLVQARRLTVPAPLRPVLAIHLAPACLIGTVAASLGLMPLALAASALAAALLVVMLARARWILAAGISPLWGAFTFPMAAFASLMLALAGTAGPGAPGDLFRIAGGVSLVAATLAIPPILLWVMQAWAKGMLGAQTNAARV